MEFAPHFRAVRKKWFKRRADKTRVATHTLLNGGILSVPYAQLDDLYSALAEDLRLPKAQFFMQELHSDVFPLYFDVDLMKVPAPDRQAVYQTLVAVLRKHIRLFWRDAALTARPDLFDVLVLVPDGQVTGAHIYLPHILVDRERATRIRYSLVAQLKHEHPQLASWGDVVDEQVYAAGLRMPGSMKLGDCTHCKARTGVADPECEHCDENGRQCLQRQYGFYALFSDVDDLLDGPAEARAEKEETRQYLAGNWKALLLKTSLRTPDKTEQTEGFAFYPGCPIPTKLKPRCANNHKLDSDHPGWLLLQDLIRRQSVRYCQLDIDRIVYTGKNNAAVMVFVSGRNATWCTNLNDYHKSARVWFYVNATHIVTRCSCKCEQICHKNKEVPDHRRFQTGVRCKDYRGPKFTLPLELRNCLFPNAKTREVAGPRPRGTTESLPSMSPCFTPLPMSIGGYTTAGTPGSGTPRQRSSSTSLPGSGSSTEMHSHLFHELNNYLTNLESSKRARRE